MDRARYRIPALIKPADPAAQQAQQRWIARTLARAHVGIDAFSALIERATPASERRRQRDFKTHMNRWRAVVELYEQDATLEKCWSAASARLANTEAAGAEDTIRDSYRLIERAGGARATLDSYRAAVRRRDRNN
jgi:hypothetical protein